MWYGYHIWSKEVLMQTENDDDLDGGQRSSEVKCGKLCDMATIFGQKNHWCKLGMMMTFMEVKANRGQIQWIIFVLPLWYLVSRWGLGSKVCMHHFGCGNGMNWIKGYYMIVKVKIETFWFSTYSMEMHSLTSSSFIICLWGETFGSRTILLMSKYFFGKNRQSPVVRWAEFALQGKNGPKNNFHIFWWYYHPLLKQVTCKPKTTIVFA